MFFRRLLGYRPQPKNNITAITPVELNRRLQANAPLLLVDVRRSDEYCREGHISGSRLLPLAYLLQRSNELPQDQPLVLICRSGRRSQTACEQLAALGFTNSINLAGGVIGWRQANLPTRF